MRLRLYLSIVLCCSGCTTIEITDRDGSVRVERNFGIVTISPEPNSSVITAKVSGFGYVTSPLGHSLGYSKQTVTIANDQCRLIVWVDEKTDREKLSEELQMINGVCISQ